MEKEYQDKTIIQLGASPQRCSRQIEEACFWDAKSAFVQALTRGRLRRHLVTQTYLLVVLIHKDELWFMFGYISFSHLRECCNDQQVTHTRAPCGRTIDRN